MTIGSIVKPGASVAQPLAIANRIGPRKAMAEALAAYLESIEFRVDGGAARDTVFNLAEVFDHWPGPEKEIVYPSASIIEGSPTEHSASHFTPTPLEGTWGTFDAMVGVAPPMTGEPGLTCLWKEGEAVSAFQVDFWCDNEPDRQAIEAALSAAMNPSEGQGGVTVEGPALYFSRPVRLSIDPSTMNDDSAVTAGRGERRLRCMVSAECDIVSLRMATTTVTPRVKLDVSDPNDPSVED